MSPFDLLRKHTPPGPLLDLLVTHSILVASLARELALDWQARRPERRVDLDFVTEAALLHDIGIVRCRAPKIWCAGDEPYIRHGVIGRAILEAEGLARHALVCERHTGAGITADEVRSAALPLPETDYLPLSIEEKIICVADKFYSKSPGKLWERKSESAIRASLEKWGPAVSARWERLHGEVTS